MWSTDAWEKQTNKYLQIPAGRSAAPLADTRVQFHQDQTHLLAVHETQIAIYEAPKLECLKQVALSLFCLVLGIESECLLVVLVLNFANFMFFVHCSSFCLLFHLSIYSL